MSAPDSRRRMVGAGLALIVVTGLAALWSARGLLSGTGTDVPEPVGSRGAVLTSKQIASRALRGTVQIRALDVLGAQRSDGSGFFVSEDGLIATNLHVVRGAYTLDVQTLYGKAYDTVYFVAADARRDLALVKVNAAGAPALPLARGTDPDVGERVFVTGNPLGQTGTFSDGLVSARRSAEGVTFIQISAPISPGSSGGPVMDEHGDVIAITTFRLLRGQNLNYAVPARYLRRLLDSLPRPARFARAQLPVVARPGLPGAGGGIQAGHASDDSVALDVIGRQLRASDSLVRAAGGSPEGTPIRGALATGDSTIHTVSLAHGGEYVIVGHCDEHCAGLDLTIVAPGGEVLDSDVAIDDAPKLRLRAPKLGRYTLRVGMADCDVKKCEYGVRLHRLNARP